MLELQPFESWYVSEGLWEAGFAAEFASCIPTTLARMGSATAGRAAGRLRWLHSKPQGSLPNKNPEEKKKALVKDKILFLERLLRTKHGYSRMNLHVANDTFIFTHHVFFVTPLWLNICWFWSTLLLKEVGQSSCSSIIWAFPILTSTSYHFWRRITITAQPFFGHVKMYTQLFWLLNWTISVGVVGLFQCCTKACILTKQPRTRWTSVPVSVILSDQTWYMKVLAAFLYLIKVKKSIKMPLFVFM